MKAGIFSIGLDTYWPQFDGLLDNLNGYHAEIRDRIGGMGIELVDAGMVDNVEKAHEVSALFKKEDVEIIFLFISTYALCGFANFSSIGIQLGGIAAVAPRRRTALAKLGLKAMFGGAIASWLTATIAGMLL